LKKLKFANFVTFSIIVVKFLLNFDFYAYQKFSIHIQFHSIAHTYT